MAVNIDAVYQKVLALANKEQRGYITPQDFNLFADQAQLEIFEQYFYDLNQARRSQGNDTVIADIDDILEDKLRVFEYTSSAAQLIALNDAASGGKILPSEVYRVLYVGVGVTGSVVECELLGTRDYLNCKRNPLTKPTSKRPIANLQGSALKCNIGAGEIPPTALTFVRKPGKPNWTYVVINKRAMYSAGSTTANFELHSSEEIQLVNKILKLAGIATQQHDIMKAGGAMENIVSIQQQKI